MIWDGRRGGSSYRTEIVGTDDLSSKVQERFIDKRSDDMEAEGTCLLRHDIVWGLVQQVQFPHC